MCVRVIRQLGQDKRRWQTKMPVCVLGGGGDGGDGGGGGGGDKMHSKEEKGCRESLLFHSQMLIHSW